MTTKVKRYKKQTYFSNVFNTFLLSEKVVLAHSTCAFFAACTARSIPSAVAGLVPFPNTLPSAGQ